MGGHITLVEGRVLLAKCKQQQSVELSTAEAEYLSLGYAFPDMLWLRNMFLELQLEVKCTVYCDSQSAIFLARSEQSTGRLNHLDIKLHFIQDELRKGKYGLEYVETTAIIADIFTKGLGGVVFQRLRDTFMQN